MHILTFRPRCPVQVLQLFPRSESTREADEDVIHVLLVLTFLLPADLAGRCIYIYIYLHMYPSQG